jgi:hypothetical protein
METGEKGIQEERRRGRDTEMKDREKGRDEF